METVKGQRLLGAGVGGEVEGGTTGGTSGIWKGLKRSCLNVKNHGTVCGKGAQCSEPQTSVNYASVLDHQLQQRQPMNAVNKGTAHGGEAVYGDRTLDCSRGRVWERCIFLQT